MGLFTKKEGFDKEKASKKILQDDLNAYQKVQDNDSNVVLDSDESEEHTSIAQNEIAGLGEEEKTAALKDIRTNCKFKQEYVDNDIILSVNHLKQYFFYGTGPNKFKLKAVHDVSFQIKKGECLV